MKISCKLWSFINCHQIIIIIISVHLSIKILPKLANKVFYFLITQSHIFILRVKTYTPGIIPGLAGGWRVNPTRGWVHRVGIRWSDVSLYKVSIKQAHICGLYIPVCTGLNGILLIVLNTNRVFTGKVSHMYVLCALTYHFISDGGWWVYGNTC